jgi:predicted dehydrogenase
MRPVGAAIIGCGLIGARRAKALEACGVPVRAVHDTDEGAAVALARALEGTPLVAASASEACARRDVDLAVVATTHAALAPLAVEAAQAGCHVLVEKPGAHTLRGVESLAKVAAEHDVLVRVGYNHRFHPSFLRAKELVDGGGYGPLLHVRARYGHGGRLGYESEWRAQREVSGGGELLDQGSHLIDLTRHLAGDVELAFSELRTEFWATEVEDNAFVALRTAGGAFAWLHASWSEWKNLFSFEITLRLAKLEITGLGGSYGPERLTLYEMGPELGPPDATSWEWGRRDDSWRLEIEDMLTELAGGQRVGAGIDDAVAAFRIVDEAYAR